MRPGQAASSMEGGSGETAPTSRGRGARETGAALVEFAVIVPVLFLILFGIIEFGSSFNDYQSVRQGVREGARQAVVQNYGTTGTSCSLTGGNSATAPTEVRRVMCLTKARIGLEPYAGVRVRVHYTASDGSPADDGSIKVCAQRNVVPLTGFIPWIDGISLESKIEMRMEKRIPATIPPGTYSEAPPTGGSWSWC